MQLEQWLAVQLAPQLAVSRARFPQIPAREPRARRRARPKLVRLAQSARSSNAARMALIWVLLTGIGIAIAVPLGWQRYYLLWIIAVILCAGIGLKVLIDMGFQRFYASILA